MKRFSIILSVLLSCLFSFPANAQKTAVILYTGSILGELKPCGCSEGGDLGGILRRATIIEKERSLNKNVLLLDAGDSFKEPTEQGKLKAQTIIESMYKMGYDAAILGEKDFIYGEEIINQGPFNHWVLSNIEDKNLNQRKTLNYFLKKLDDGTIIAVIGLLGSKLLYLKGQKKVKIENPLTKLKELLKKLKTVEKANIILLITHMEKDEAKELFNVEGVDIIINGHLSEDKKIDEPVITGNRIMVHARERGQYLGKITITLNQHKIQDISNQYIPLTPEIAASQSVRAIYDRYDEEAKQLFLNWLKDKKKHKDSPFVRMNACQECHEEAYTVWEKSDHAHAFNSIKEANKTFDPECLLCHTTGFKQEGGFSKIHRLKGGKIIFADSLPDL